jgi:DNA-binding transcriptional LysR family regulator
MKRDSLDDLRVFVLVAEHRSFREAAAQLARTPSAVSHTMRQLEERLGMRLLHRTTRSVSLTDAGLRLLERLRPALLEISSAVEGLNEERSRPLGRLRIYANHTAAVAVVAPVWDRFLASYPDIHLELDVSERLIDIVAAGFDAGIGPSDRAANDMIAVPVTGPLKMAVVGAPSYFARRGAPRTPEDLARHGCIQHRLGDGTLFEWLFERGGKLHKRAVEGPVTVTNLDLALRAAVDGLGLAYLTRAYAEPFLRSGQLVEVLGEALPSFEGLFLYYPGHRRVPAALRVFVDMVRVSGRRTASGKTLMDLFIPS